MLLNIFIGKYGRKVGGSIYSHDRWACFTPLCFFVDGMLGTDAGYFMHRLANVLCIK